MTIRVLGMPLGDFVFIMYLTLQALLIIFVIWMGRREGLNWVSMARTHRTYIRAVAHAIDMASDFGVICTLYTARIESSWFNSRRVAVFMIVIQVFYRLVSSYQVFRAARNLNTGDEWKVAFLQLCDVLVFREVYNSFIQRRMWPTQIMHQVRTLECVLESSPQIAVQLTYYLKTQAADRSSDANYFVLVSLIISFISVSSIVLKSDDKSFTPRDWEPTERKAHLAKFNFRAPPTLQFLIRLGFRFLEIFGRMTMIALLWMVLPGQVITVFMILELMFYFFLFEKGIIGNNWLSVLTFPVYHPNWTMACDQKLLRESRVLKILNLGLLNAEDYLLDTTHRRKSAIEGHVVAPVGLKQLSTADEFITDDLLGTEDMIPATTETELHMKGSLALNRTIKESMTSVTSFDTSPAGAREVSVSGKESSFVLDSSPPALVTYSITPNNETEMVVSSSLSTKTTKQKPKKRHHSDLTGIKSSKSKRDVSPGSPRSQGGGSSKKKTISQKKTVKISSSKKPSKSTKKGTHRKVESSSLTLTNRTSDKSVSKSGMKKVKPTTARLTAANSGDLSKKKSKKKRKSAELGSGDIIVVEVINEDATEDPLSSEMDDTIMVSPPPKIKKAAGKGFGSTSSIGKKRKSGNGVNVKSKQHESKLADKRGSLTTMSLTLVNTLSKDKLLDDSNEMSVSQDGEREETSVNYDDDEEEEDYDMDCEMDIAMMDGDSEDSTLSVASPNTSSLGFFKGITNSLRNQGSGRGRGYSALMEAALKRSSDNKMLIRSHYIHMFTKSMFYMIVLNVFVWTNVIYDSTYRRRGSQAIRNNSLVFSFYIFAMISPFLQLALFFGYLGKFANLPDPITLAKWCWIEGFESLVRNEPENVNVLAHSVDSKGHHMLYVLMTTPLTNNHSKYRYTRGYGEVYEMTSYILRLGGNLEYLKAFYRNFEQQAKELVIRMAVYIVDLCLIKDKDDAMAVRLQRSEEDNGSMNEDNNPNAEDNGNDEKIRGMMKNKRDEDQVHIEFGFNQYGLWTRMRRVRKPRAMLIAQFRQIMGLFRSVRPSGNFDKKDCAKFFGYALRAFNERLEVTSSKKSKRNNHKKAMKKQTNSTNEAKKLLRKRETLMGNLIDPRKIAVNPVRLLFEQISYVCGNNPDTYDYLLSVFSLEFYQFLDAYTRFVLKHMDDVGAGLEDNHYFQSGIDSIVRCLTPAALSRFLTKDVVGGGSRVIFDGSSADSASKEYVVAKCKGIKGDWVINNVKRTSLDKCVLCLTKRYNASFQPQFVEIPLDIRDEHSSMNSGNMTIPEEKDGDDHTATKHGFGISDVSEQTLRDLKEIPVNGEFEIKLRIQNTGSLKFDRGTKLKIDPIGPSSMIGDFKLKILNSSEIRLDSLDTRQSRIFNVRIGYQWRLANDDGLSSLIYSLQNSLHYRIRVTQRSRNVGLFCVLKFKVDFRSLVHSLDLQHTHNDEYFRNMDADMACLLM